MKVNLYKILTEKKEEFFEQINLEYKMESNEVRQYRQKSVHIQLYIDRNNLEGTPKWQWIIDELTEGIHLKTYGAPKGILTVSLDDELYAFSFSHAHHCVHKFADKEFAFRFARKLDYKEIKRTAKAAPHSSKVKMIDAFKDNKYFDFDSGEAYLKVKATQKLPRDFGIYKENIEIGDALSVELKNDCLTHMLALVFYAKRIITSEKEEIKIPLLKKLDKNDDNLIKKLDGKLIKKIIDGETPIYFSDFDIIGNIESFNDYSTEYTVHYLNRKPVFLDGFDINDLRMFIEKNKLIGEDIFKIFIGKEIEGKRKKYEIKKILDYTDEEERYTLLNGEWYSYNNDYIDYLNDSLSEIPVIYNPEYDFSKKRHETFCAKKYEEEKNRSDFTGKTKKEIKESIKIKYYKERVYNLLLAEENEHLENHDRQLTKLSNNEDIEIADIYCKETQTLFAVKIGDASSKLSYVVTQSLASLDIIRSGLVKDIPSVEKIGLWLVLDKKTKLIEREKGIPDLTYLKMFLFKNYLDNWKKHVLYSSKKPVIYINYMIE